LPVARFRRPIMAVQVALTLVLASVGAREAAAQDMTDARLFIPVPDGDPKNPSRFRRPSFGNPAGSGAGTTGFVSTNPQRLKQPRAAPAPLPAIVPADQTLHPVYREAAPAARRPVTTTTIVADPALPHLRRQVVRRTPIEEDPFGPVGVRVGSFVLKPSIEPVRGYDSNVTRSLIRSGSWLSTVTAQLLAQSEWSRHELKGSLRGAYTWYDQLEDFNKPDVEAKVNARIDITSQTRSDIEGRYQLLADAPGDPNTPGDTIRPPIYEMYGGTVGLTHRFNRLEVTGKALIDRLQYWNAMLDDGSILNLSDRNYNQYGGSARVGYEIVPGIKPFVEAGLDSRVYDDSTSSNPTRNSQGKNWRVGVEFELTRKLTGTVSAGQVHRHYDDPTLPSFSGLIVDGNLLWAATPLTTVKLDLKSSVEEVVLPGVSGGLKRDAVLQVDHAFRRWLLGTLSFGYGNDDYFGLDRIDNRYFTSVALTYKMTRTVHVKGEFRQEWLRSTDPGANYDASTAMLSVKLQR
jgi:hypothetical protein